MASVGLSTDGTKSELLVVRLALWNHTRAESMAGRIDLEVINLSELEALKGGIGLDVTTSTKKSLIEALTRYWL